MSIANKLGLRYSNLSRSARVELIEYWVSNPGTTMKQLGDLFQTNEWAASRIIRRDYLGPMKAEYVLFKASKINEPELITI